MRKIYDIVAAISLLTIIGLAVIATKEGGMHNTASCGEKNVITKVTVKEVEND